MPEQLATLETWAQVGVLAAAAGAVGLLAHWIVWRAFRRLARRTNTILDDSLARRCYHPTLYIFPALSIQIGMQSAPQVPAEVATIAGRVLALVLTLATAWTLVRLTAVAQDVVARRYATDAPDDLQARRIQTQFQILRRISVVVIGVVTLGVILMSEDRFRELGTGLLASAGLAGLIVGLSAQRALTNLLAGIQIAITQPIRLNDAVVVEGEWGHVEEISLTYVVVRVWDLRRLVLPISYFLEHPFQNWTRVSSELLGTVTIHVDPQVPVGAIRTELERIVKASDEWNGKAWALEVIDTSAHAIQLRALVSADDASKLWRLRCAVRERLIAFVQARYPGALPKLRAELRPPLDVASGGGTS